MSTLGGIFETFSTLTIVMIALSGFVFVGIVIAVIISVVKHKGFSPTQEMKKMADAVKELRGETEDKKAEEAPTCTCAYCGATYEKSKGKCPSCGASVIKKSR